MHRQVFTTVFISCKVPDEVRCNVVLKTQHLFSVIIPPHATAYSPPKCTLVNDPPPFCTHARMHTHTHTSILFVFMFEKRNPNFVLVVLHAEKLEIFGCLDCRLAAPIAFFKGSLPLETFKCISIIFDDC